MMYTNLKRNRIGGINGILESGVESTLSIDECELAEAGEWGVIADYTQAEEDAYLAQLLIDQSIATVQAMLDTEAQSRGYDNINAIGKYIGYDNPFRSECETLGAWCASCWAKCYELQAGGVIPDDLLTEMPKLV